MAPLEVARETLAHPLRAGTGAGVETRSVPPPVRSLGPAAARLEGPPAMARTAMFCRIPVPGARTQPPPRSRAQAAVSWRGPRRRAPLGMSRGVFSPAAHTFLRALPSREGQLLELPSASLDPVVAWLRGEEMASSGHEGYGHWGVTGPLSPAE